MKFFWCAPFVLLVILAACRKEEAYWDKLTPAQQAAVRERAYQECEDEVGGDIADFQADSAAVYASNKWERHDAWKHTLTSGTESKIIKVRVWKNDGATLYLAVSETSETPIRQYFIRIPLATNQAMIEDLQEQICRRVDVDDYNSGSAIAVTNVYNINADGGVHTYTDTYNFKFDQLALAASLWNYKRRIVKKNASGNQTEDKTWTSTFAALSGEANLNADPDLWSKTYCDIDLPAANPDYPDLNYLVPYEATPTTTTCITTAGGGIWPAGWNLAP